MNTKCSNTSACWECPAPVSIELTPEADSTRFRNERGIITNGRMLHLTIGALRQGYQTPHLSLCLPVCEKPFTILHKDIIRVADMHGATIWENAEQKRQKR